MKKLLPLLFISFITSQSYANGPYKFYCEWEELVKIHEEYSSQGKGIDTNWIEKMGWDKKFTLSREGNILEIEGEKNSPDSIKIPINLHQVFEPNKNYVFFAGAKASDFYVYSFLYSYNSFYFSQASQGSLFGGITSGIAKCTY